MPHKILIVEDDPDIREAEKALFELDGYDVEVAGNGREAVDRLQSNGKPCVILLDLMMPEMDGWEFLEWRRESGPWAGVPTVVVTAADESRIQQLDADDVLTKPLDLNRMMNVVRLYCDSSSARSC